MAPLRVAIVGCGEATQILHLPALALLRGRFPLGAVCDASAHVAEEVGRRWNVPVREADWRAVVGRDDVDVVLVAVPDAFHAAVTIAALEAGKHVLVEKPLCMTLREADEIEAARRSAGRVVQVGYVRRYAPAVAAARELVDGLGGVRFARFRDILGLNPLVVEQTADVVRGDDLPDEATAAAVETRDRLVAEAIGPAPPEVGAAYRLLLSLGCHDVSLMRELLGPPRGVLYAATRHDAWYVSAALDYGPFVCHLELGYDRIPRVEATAEVYGPDRVVRLDYDTPFVRNLPVRLRVTEAVDGRGVSERVLHTEWADPFVREWEAFHDAVTIGGEPKASVADARHDLELFAEMARLMR